MATDAGTIGRCLRWMLAALSAGAAAIHFGILADHFRESWPEGVFFAALAWFQVAWAIGVVVRPTRRLLVAGALLNAGVIGVWAISRLWGVPVGPNVWTPENVSLADALASSFEAVMVLGSLVVLVWPALANRSLRAAFGIPGVAITTLGVAVISSLALTPTFTSSHGHGTFAGISEAAHSHAPSADVGSDSAVAKTPCGRSGPPVFEGQNTGAHNHRGPAPGQPIRSAAVRAELAAQIQLARAAAARHPTVGDAVAAGYRELTPYLPCIGAHYVNDLLFMAGRFDPAAPAILIYDGTRSSSKIVGLSYVVQSDRSPKGFAGPNDLWHAHRKLCVSTDTGVVIGSERTSDRRCAAKSGRNFDLHRAWMMHAWVVPGWESSWGIFSSEHPDLGGNGSILTL